MGGHPDISILSTEDEGGGGSEGSGPGLGTGSQSGTSRGSGPRAEVGQSGFGGRGAGAAGTAPAPGGGSRYSGVTVSSSVIRGNPSRELASTPGSEPSGSAVMVRTEVVEGTLDYISIPLARNYDSFYLNPDLESLLNTRGFSTKRPEIIGMFNYIAPLSRGATDGTGAAYLINPSGELYDYQCQLKQLRYSDASRFFSQKVGVGMGESGELVANTQIGSILLAQYKQDMFTAESILNYLTEIYNGVSSSIDAEGLETAYFDILDRGFSNTSQYPNPIAQDVIESTPEFSTNPNANSLPQVYATEPVSFMYFLRLVTGQAVEYGGSGIIQPSAFGNYLNSEVYGDDAPTRLVSGTYAMVTMLNFIAGCLHGLSAYPMDQNSADEKDQGVFNASEDFGRKLPGYSRFIMKKYSFLEDKFTLERSVTDVSMNRNGYGFSYPDYSSSNLKGWTAPSYFTARNRSRGGRADVLYRIGLDCIQGHAFDSALANDGKIGGISAPPASLGPARAMTFITNMLGTGNYNTKSTILDSLPAENSNSLTRKIIVPNEDEDFDSRTAIESFTSTNFLLAEGVEKSRSGRSYYCDEIVTNEISESTDRLVELGSRMQGLGLQLKDISTLYYKKRAAISNSFSSPMTDSLFYERNPGDTFIKPSDMHNYLVRAIRQSYVNLISDTQGSIWSDIADSEHLLASLIAAAAAQDDEIMHYVAMYNLAFYYNKNPGKSGFSKTEDTNIVRYAAMQLEELFIDKSCEIIKEKMEDGGKGAGEPALYQNDPVGIDGKQAASQIFDHYDRRDSDGGLAGTSSSYHYFPRTGTGIGLDNEGESDWSEALARYGGPVRDDLKRKIRGALGTSSEDMDNILLAPYRALCEFEKDLAGINNSSSAELQNFSARSIDPSAKLQGLLTVWRNYVKMSLSAGLYLQKERKSSSGMGDSKHDYGGSYTLFYGLYMVNMRGIGSFIDFADLVLLKDSSYNSKTKNFSCHTKEDSEGLGMDQHDEYTVQENYRRASGNYGYYQDINSLYAEYKKVSENIISREVYFTKALGLVAHAADRIRKPTSDLIQLIQSNNTAQGLYDEAISGIRSDPNFQNAALLSITRDQLSLNRSLYDSFSVPNREYHYLPASKAIMVEQTKNLSGYLKEPDLLDNESIFRRFIGTVGLPAGSLENLRNRMMDQTGNIDYRFSTLLEVAIWKRDLLHEDRVYYPKRFLFDTSRMMIYGRTKGTARSSELIDDAIVAATPQNFERVRENAIFRKYTPNGNVYTRMGSAYESEFYSNSQDVDTQNIDRNLLVDYYLKLFMRLTTGIDVSEDVFPFLEGNVFFDTVDPGLVNYYEEIAESLKTMFVDFSSIEASLNYDRLLGEIRRSVYMSSEKYRNRIIYPKVFERTFCVLIDPESFELASVGTPSADTMAEFVVDMSSNPFGGSGTTSGNNTDPTYSQYYATIGLKPPFESPESGLILFDSGTGARRIVSPQEFRRSTDEDLYER